MNPARKQEFSKSITVWSDVRWPEVEERVDRLQKRIFEKSRTIENKLAKNESVNDDVKALRFLQQKVTTSLDACLLAVRRVTLLNKGRKTPGIDSKSNLTAQERLELARNLRITSFASPILVKEIPKPGTNKTRKLGIPTIKDRATQMLVKMALEPEWEAKFEANSFGFRPKRSCHDATSATWHALRMKQKFVLDADISACFDKIDHEKLLMKLNCSKELKQQINAWLKAEKKVGFPKRKEWQTTGVGQTPMGTPQGGIISPLLANIALHGMEDAVRKFYVEELYHKLGFDSSVAKSDRLRQVSIIRYADDFVIIHESYEVVLACKNFVSEWLKENAGLSLSEAKTSIVNSGNGFEFLGFQFISITEKETKRTKCRASVSAKSKKRLISKVHNVLQKHRSSTQELLIKTLNPIIIGWCNYYCVHECSKDFKQVEGTIFKMLESWANRRAAKGMGVKAVMKKYFNTEEKREIKFRGKTHRPKWIFGTMSKTRSGTDNFIFLALPSWVTSKRHLKIKGKASPFDKDTVYWSKRDSTVSQIKPSLKKLLGRQQFTCGICHKKFASNTSETMEIDHIIPISKGGSDKYENLQVVHQSCHQKKTREEQKGPKGPAPKQ